MCSLNRLSLCLYVLSLVGLKTKYFRVLYHLMSSSKYIQRHMKITFLICSVILFKLLISTEWRSHSWLWLLTFFLEHFSLLGRHWPTQTWQSSHAFLCSLATSDTEMATPEQELWSTFMSWNEENITQSTTMRSGGRIKCCYWVSGNVGIWCSPDFSLSYTGKRCVLRSVSFCEHFYLGFMP